MERSPLHRGNLIARFAQGGWAQALLAFVGIAVLVRYRFLVPFAWLLQVLDWGGRALVGQLKPLVGDAVADGPQGRHRPTSRAQAIDARRRTSIGAGAWTGSRPLEGAAPTSDAAGNADV